VKRPTVAECLLEAFGRGPEAPLADFDAFALDAFTHQFEHNEPYRRYCERRGATPETVRAWQDVPAVPTAAFKETVLVCGPKDAAEAVFRTSGTTRGAQRRGTHYVLDLALYRGAALSSFRAFALPDEARLPMAILALAAARAPDSSLSRMLDWVRDAFGAPGSVEYVTEAGLRVHELLRALRRAEADATPLFLIGTAFAFVHVLDAMAERGLHVRLPEGSRVLETGGLKGCGREVTREELYAELSDRLDVADSHIIAEYGMTEMCSQFYDTTLRDATRGAPAEPRRLVPPSWVRTRVVDPESLRPLHPGEVGLLRHFDLANLNSVCALQTDDLGVAVADGFHVLGRARGGEARGCSIAFDEWLSATR
jgi:acyl-CoA synthetase (AMP-forming)/AMP-acid ligase II